MSELIVFKVFAFVFGAMIGSFLNALIHRIPLNISIALPRSKCPNCDKTIYWFENVPILSYLFLRGKCSGCKTKISLRYPIVELFMGLGTLYLFPESFHPLVLTKYALHISILACFVIHFFIDLKHKILPDSVNIYLALCLLALAILEYNWKHIVIGGSIGFFFPLIVTWLFYVLRGQIGLGGGDIKLFGALGLYLGPLGIVYNLFASCFVGAFLSITLIVLKKMDKNNPIPFGPFIIIAALLQIFFPKEFNAVIGTFFIAP